MNQNSPSYHQQKKNRTYEAANHPYLGGGEKRPADIPGSVGGIPEVPTSQQSTQTIGKAEFLTKTDYSKYVSRDLLHPQLLQGIQEVQPETGTTLLGAGVGRQPQPQRTRRKHTSVKSNLINPI